MKFLLVKLVGSGLCGCDSFTRHQHIEYGMLSDVADGLFVGHHGKVVAIALKDLVMDAETGLCRGTRLVHLSHVNTLKNKWLVVTWIRIEHSKTGLKCSLTLSVYP